MKLICPGCGLGGTAEVEVYEKKVRCPQCRNVFRVTSEVIVGLAQNGFEVIKQSIDTEVGIDEELSAHLNNPSVDEEDGGEVSRTGGAICSRCGFTLSGTFIRFVDNRPVCFACAGQTTLRSFA